MNYEKFFNEFIEESKNFFTEQVVETWLQKLKVKNLDGENLVLEAPNKFYKIWIEQNYLETLKKILSEKFSITSDIVIKNANVTLKRDNINNNDGNKIADIVVKQETNLNKQYSFDNFVVGASNQFAYTACFSVANGNFHTYNPLYIYGGVGLGKTHLLHAIGNKLLETKYKLKVLYIPSEQFTNEMITSIRKNKMDEFREKYRTIDILLFDDAQFLAGKERTTEEFFYTFNTLYDLQKQIVISCDKSPSELSHMEKRITSRFSWGLIVDIQAPSVEEKSAILLKIAELKNINIDNNIAIYLAENLKTDNNRELIGALIRLSAYSNFKNKPIDKDLIHECLKQYLIERNKIISIDDILKEVTSYFNIKLHDLKSRKRTSSLAYSRNIAIYILRKTLNLSLQEIGDIFGGRDHATILYSIKKIESALKKDKELRYLIDTIIKNLYK